MGNAPKAIGLDQFHVAPLIKDDWATGEMEYGEPVRIPEAIQVQVNPQNFSEKFFSDDGVSEVNSGTTGAQVQFTIAGAEAEIHAAILGKAPPSKTDEYIFEDFAIDPAPVAFGYRRKIGGRTKDGRTKYRYIWLLKVVFTPPNEQGDTQGEKVNIQPGQYSGEAFFADAFRPGKNILMGKLENWREGITQEKEDNFFKAVRWKQPGTPPVEPPEDPEDP